MQNYKWSFEGTVKALEFFVEKKWANCILLSHWRNLRTWSCHKRWAICQGISQRLLGKERIPPADNNVARFPSAVLRAFAHAFGDALLEVRGVIAEFLGRLDVSGRLRVRVCEHRDDAQQNCLDRVDRQPSFRCWLIAPWVVAWFVQYRYAHLAVLPGKFQITDEKRPQHWYLHVAKFQVV